MKKRNLKAIFLGLLSRRWRAGDKSSPDRAAAGAPQDAAAARSRIKLAPSGHKTPPVLAETISATVDQPPQEPPGPPADWLAKRSSGPPPHWVERVRPAAPELLQDCERGESEAASPPQPPRQVQLKPSSGPPPQLQRPAQSRPLRLQRPALAPVSTRRPERSSAATSDRARPEFQRLEPPAPSSSAGAQKGDAELSDRCTDKPSRLAHDSGTIWQIAPRISASAGLATESQQMSPLLPLRIDRAMAGGLQGEAAELASPEDQGPAVPMVLPPVNVRRPSGAEPHGQARVDTSGALQSKRNSGEVESQQVEPATSWMRRVCDGDEAPLHIPIISAGPSQIVKFSRRQTPKPENGSREHITHYPDVIRREAQSFSVSQDRPAFKPGNRQEMNTKEVTKPMRPQGAQDQPVASYDVSPGRWPELLQSSSGDYVDDLMGVLRELRHNRRLAREQAGNLWSE